MYGKTFKNDAPAWKAGINDFDRVKFLGLVSVETNNYSGSALDLILEKDGKETNDRMFPVNPNSIRPRNIKDRDTGERREETQQEAIDRAYGEFNSRVKHIYTNFISEEEFMTVQADSFESYIKMLTEKLPEDYDQKPGQVILGYNKGGYLEVPRYMWITGHFLSIEGQKDLNISDKVNLHKTPEASGGSESSPDPVTW